MNVMEASGAISTVEFDRLMQQEKTLQTEVMLAIATALRSRHADSWLIALYNPTERDESDIGRAATGCFQRLAKEGRTPDWGLIQSAAQQWLKRYIHSRRTDRMKVLRDLIDKVAAKGAGDGALEGHQFVLSAERRAAVGRDLKAEIDAVYLGPEQVVANDVELLTFAEWLVKENLGAGALEDFLRDTSLTEIMVGAGGQIWVEKDGRVGDTHQRLPEERARWFAQRLAAMIGSRIDQSEPAMDGYLEDGSRVHVILPPIAMDGVSLTVRRHSRRPSLEQLVRSGAMSQEACDFLHDAVAGMANVLISGGTSSGKTTILNVLAGFIGGGERVLTMEDAPELRLPLPHVIRMRTRKANLEGRGEFTMRMLVKESLRMRPDRIVVGEVRGAEALDMIEAMNTGHDGCLSTAHSNGPQDMLKRLAQMMKRGDPQLTDSGAYELIASALHLIVHAERRVSSDGVVTRGIMEIAEVVSYRSDRPGIQGFVLQTVFLRGEDRVLRRVGRISDRLAMHLRLNGIPVDSWVAEHAQ